MRVAIPLSQRKLNFKNEKISDEEFFGERKKILGLWPTGKEIDLDECIAYHKSMPKSKNAVYKLQQAKKEGTVLTQPRGGICLVDEYVKWLKLFQDKGKADILTAQSDSYTRNKRFDKAQTAWEESKKLGRSTLNGCPWVNWGLKESRRLIESIDVPLDGRAGTDIFSMEFALAAGATTFLGGVLNSGSYYPKDPPEKTIREMQQVSRLQGYYTEHGVPIASDSHAMSGPSYPVHSLEVAQVIIDSLIEAEQGVKYIILRCRQTMNLFQDVAKARALQALAGQYMKKCGHGDVETFLGFEDWVAAFPPDNAQAAGLVAMGAMSAHFTGAQNIMIKSLDEGLGLPTTESVVFSLRETKQVLNAVKHQKLPYSKEVEDEQKMIMKEATLILEKVFEMGDGDVAIGSIKAIDVGVIDHPFSSSVYNAGKVFPTRDANGMVRYLNTGNLPFTKEIIEFHREKVEDRKKVEKIEKDYKLMIEDITSFTRDV